MKHRYVNQLKAKIKKLSAEIKELKQQQLNNSNRNSEKDWTNTDIDGLIKYFKNNKYG